MDVARFRSSSGARRDSAWWRSIAMIRPPRARWVTRWDGMLVRAPWISSTTCSPPGVCSRNLDGADGAGFTVMQRRRLAPRAPRLPTPARQLLLQRVKPTPLSLIERLVGMQAQLPRPPYVGIWSRASGFKSEHLTRLVLGRKAVRATTMRGTLHLMTTKDYLSLRGALQPALTAGALALLPHRVERNAESGR